MADSTLTIFGGMVPELNPSDLPQGAAAICCNCDFTVASARTRDGIASVYPANSVDFNYVKTFAETDGGVLTLALDKNGTLWQEDVNGAPGILTSVYTGIEPGSFARSVTEDDREFIALSNLTYGTDMPRQYDGESVQRISQVGPGAPPGITFNSQSYAIVSITQQPAVSVATWDAFLWSAGPTLRIAGTVVTVYGPAGTAFPGELATNLVVGASVVLAGLTGGIAALNNGGANPAVWVVTSVGTAVGGSGTTYPIFTFNAPSSNLIDAEVGGGDYSSGTLQLTLATATTAVPVPNLQVGSTMNITGVTPGTWNGGWTVLETPNASQLLINTTSLSGGVATYDFTLISGTAPTVGEQVTVTGTSNGNGIFNVSNSTITSVGPGSLSLKITSPNIPPAAESGNGIVNGTMFQFDPMEVIANGSGGGIVVAGGLGAGQRFCVCIFQTEAGYLTEPSPSVSFYLNEAATAITVTKAPIGPPNVIKRIFAFTGANGAFYFYIPVPVTIQDPTTGQNVTYNSTVINDNTTLQATFSFVDTVLFAGISVDVQGNNLFEQIELGSCTGFVVYSSRLFAFGENNKVQNLLNPTFDGGIGSVQPPPGDPSTKVQTYPLGWTIDPTYGAGGSVVLSPIFGDAFQVLNNTAGTAVAYGMITQSAYQDYYQAPIIDIQTTYSIRVTAETLPGFASVGSIVVDLFSTSLDRTFGIYILPGASLTDQMQIFTGTLLTAPFETAVPNDLIIRVYAINLPAFSGCIVDRIEVFPTLQPVLSTQLRASYVNNFEAFDGLTGNLGPSQNQQPVTNAFTLYDNLYIVKSGSFYSTSDNGITEPSGWTTREVSNKVGTTSILGVDVGEGWALIAGLAGVYMFDGGEPIKITPEIDPVWQAINWSYGQTIWIRNDTNNRRICIGVPLATPNQWMPNFPENANPTEPNVVLMMNYKELMTSKDISFQGAIRQSYQGTLRTFQLGRKWSAWSISAAYADFIQRQDGTEPLFYCGDTETGKIYQQLANNWSDDSEGILCSYCTYGIPKSDEAQQLQLGEGMYIATYLTMVITGEGNLAPTIIPNTLGSPYADALITEPLGNPPPYGDMELPLQEVGNRFFTLLQTSQPGEHFEISRLVMEIAQHPFAPKRGSN